MESAKRQTVEYKFLKQSTYHSIQKIRFSFTIYLAIFQIAFIILYGFFASYHDNPTNGVDIVNKNITKNYPMFMNVHTMMVVGFGFLMVFLKRFGYSSIGFNFLVAAYVVQWAILIRGWLHSSMHGGVNGSFTIDIKNLMSADYCAIAVLISFAALVGKVSLSQLIVMATIEVVVQSVNEFACFHYLHAYDVGKAMYVHLFGAFFGLAVSKILCIGKNTDSNKDSSHYHSDLFSMVGTLFLWVYWPSFNSALAVNEGQQRAIINTYLALASSCITTFLVSMFVGAGRLNMVHIRNATLAGGVAVGAVADMVIQPFGAMLIGSFAGIISTLGYRYITPYMNETCLHDSCGVNNLFGMPGLIAGLASAIAAALATQDLYHGERLFKFYPSRIPQVNSTEYNNLSLGLSEYSNGGLGRTAIMQGSYQIAAVAVTLGIALVSGLITGFIIKLPIIEQIDENEEMFDDEPHWMVPEDYSLRLTEVKVNEEEMVEKHITSTHA